ncbi:alpha-D-ribose 1-methylphosphonate 5-triphosphate synthase subunit PhnH [Neobacillus niacini]|uniref:phosphonate C-P lyase system protein PhnH n=1 Tax=Neobacillus niacini TaxID=86668 RepID=UPI00277ED227|nr:phosphonate C-P lyase system protein PhnH [Neobacillus niacini]MDQ1000550.1 alpha-D-ribose 1-methylphosphonate 5-triphosphate synthase subunit PhnH [Neobacillus niacini]
MTLDIVHDLQSVYRKLVDSTSRPGLISDLRKEAALVEEEDKNSCSASVLLVAQTLFDQEVSFKVFSPQADSVSKTINQLTYAKPTEAKKADFLLILQDAEKGCFEEAINHAKVGTLKNPHKSAFLIVEAKSVTSGEALLLKGPGIHTTELIHMDVNETWVESRQEKNKEYPLGIDLIFIDQHHQLIALPRTTQITRNRVMG